MHKNGRPSQNHMRTSCVLHYYANNKELMQQMQNVALEEQAVELLVETAQVKDKKASFQDIMNPEGK